MAKKQNQPPMLPHPPAFKGTSTPYQNTMPALPEKEIQKRLTNLENGGNQANRPTVKKIGDQYQLAKDTIYTAYAFALLNLSSEGKIVNQSDASTFQFSPYDSLGVLLPFRGYFQNNSTYQSGDPTDYTWESTLEDEGFEFSERYFTNSGGLKSFLGNPTKPLNSTTWTSLATGVAAPTTAAFVAERFNIKNSSGDVSSPWAISPSGKYINTAIIADNAVTDIKIATGITAAKLIGPLPAISGAALTALPPGSVLQVVNVVYTAGGNTSSSTYSDTGLTASITPSSTSSKILTTISASLGNSTAATNNNVRIVRGSTELQSFSRVMFNSTGHSNGQQSFINLDSPNTTSATTYKLQFMTDGGSFRFNDSAGDTPSSTITLMEIAG